MAGTPPPPQNDASARERDPYMAHYLASVDLARLDLDNEAFDAPAGESHLWAWVGGVLWTAVLVALIVVPSTSFYQLHALSEPLYLGLWALFALLSASMGQLARNAWRRSNRTLDADALAGMQQQALQALAPLGRLFGLGPSGQRMLLGASIVVLVAALVLAMPQDAQWAGQTYSGAWFVAAAMAVVTGILVGRFIIAHAQRTADAPARPRAPIVLPSWFRWVTLAALVAGAAAVLVVHARTPEGDTSLEFALAAGGMALGVGTAIWLARRFDELEARWTKEAAKRRADALAGGVREGENR